MINSFTISYSRTYKAQISKSPAKAGSNEAQMTESQKILSFDKKIKNLVFSALSFKFHLNFEL